MNGPSFITPPSDAIFSPGLGSSFIEGHTVLSNKEETLSLSATLIKLGPVKNHFNIYDLLTE